MEHLAEARIVAWQGGSLWLLNTAPPASDMGPRTDFHAHHAVQIVISLGGEFRLWQGDQEQAGPYAAVAPDAPHRFDAHGAYAILFVEPEGRAGRAIQAAILGARALCPLPESRLQAVEAQLEALGRTPWPNGEDLIAIGRRLIDDLAGDDRPLSIDPRIRKIVAWVAERQDDPVTLSAAARLAGLSESRVSHLFVAQTGLSFKTYLLWVRLTQAVRLMTEGQSLTAVAHGAGFSDSAHFSRTFRRMFGIAPANLKLV